MAPTGTPRVPRVLVVDDEPSILAFTNRVLDEAGYEVVVASGGTDALRIVAEQPAFDVFVIDVQMPDMRGDELARRIRQAHPDAKVLYFTGFSDRLFDERTMLWQDEAFLEKPATVQGLRQSVSLILLGHTGGPDAEG